MFRNFSYWSIQIMLLSFYIICANSQTDGPEFVEPEDEILRFHQAFLHYELHTQYRTILHEEIFKELNGKIQHLEELVDEYKTIPSNVLEIKCNDNDLPENCHEINECNEHLYNIHIPGYSNDVTPVACDLQTEGGGWTIIQRRQDGSVDFFRDYATYVKGFGDINAEFFIGLEKLHKLTTQDKPQELRIILKNAEGKLQYANYKIFKVHSKSEVYKLEIGNYSGNAGDCLSSQNDQTFSTWNTFDEENEINCAEKHKAAWWYTNSCYKSNLNGLYHANEVIPSNLGITWCTYGHEFSIKYVQMMIRPNAN